MTNFEDEKQALQMIIDRTGDLGGGYSLVEKLQRLLDLPCEICRDGEVIAEQQQKIDRLYNLLRKTLTVLEELSEESIMGTDLEENIGITYEEYNVIMGLE